MSARLRLVAPFAVLVAVIVFLVLADAAIVTVRLTSTHPSTSSPQANGGGPGSTKQHPCNHGYYVSKAAHSHQGGAGVGDVAKSKLGKDGNCSAPLPAAGGSQEPEG